MCKPFKYSRKNVVLPQFQLIGRFGFPRYTIFIMYLDISYIYVHNESYVAKKSKITYNL